MHVTYHRDLLPVDFQVVTPLMAKTYPFRRKEIVEDGKRIGEVLKVYPSLGRYDQVSLNVQVVRLSVYMHVCRDVKCCFSL